MAKEFFPGGNTVRGFTSYYHNLLACPARRRILLKGGPGVGKSTLLRKLAAAWEARGEEVELFRCSGDPDSLDAVTVPRLGWEAADGTAPHVLDPLCPGAVDSIFNLGAFLDEGSLRERREELRRLQAVSREAYDRAYGYLTAAWPLARGATLLWNRLQPGLTESAPTERRALFADAVTWKGEVSLLHTLPAAEKRVWYAPAPVVSALPGRLGNRLWGPREATLALMDPLAPESPRHVYFPDSALLLTQTRDPALATEGWREPEGEDREYLRRVGDAASALLRLAVGELTRAKEAHDGLEAVYRQHMDFPEMEKRAAALLDS